MTEGLSGAQGEQEPGSNVATTPGDGSSYRQILRATSIVGGGKIATIFLGLIRSKVLAVLLGPAGIGVMGLLQGVMTTTATLFGLGLRQSGVREVSANADDPAALKTIWRALWLSHLIFGTLGLVVMWVFRARLSELVFDTPARADDVGWMGVGIVLVLATATQTAFLQGLRRLADMVKASLLGTGLGTAAGLAFVWWLGLDGVRWFVLATPTFTFMGTAWYARRLPKRPAGPPPFRLVLSRWRQMASLGAYLMISTLVGGISAIAARSILTHELSIDSAGQFQAAIAISGHYLGLVLGAMAADYFPRLSGAAGDPKRFVEIVNDQLEVALLLIAPILLAVLALTPLALTAVYSTEFTVASQILRWQIVADVLKIASWALGFMVLARGEGPLYLFLNSSGDALFLLSLYLGIPLLGLEAAGIAALIQMAYSLLLIGGVVRTRYQYSPREHSLRAFLLLLGSAIVTAILCNYSEVAGGLVGGALSLVALRAAYLGMRRAG